MRISDWSSDVCSSDLDGDPRVAFVCDEDRLPRGREEHGIGLPMACLLAGGDIGGAVVDRGTIGVGWPTALGAPSALILGAGAVAAPAPVLGTAQCVLDDALAGLVADYTEGCFQGPTAP